MARQMIEAGRAAGESMPDVEGMCHNIRRWESGEGGLTERYKLAYCKALGMTTAHFGGGTASPAALVPDQAAPSLMTPASASVTTHPDPGVPASSTFAYRGMRESVMGDSTVQREVLMAAHEGSEHAEGAEQRCIGDATLDQLRSDVIRLSREYMTGEPFPLFVEMRRVRGRMHDALDRRMWPRDATQLYLLLGCVNCLMANVASDLDNPQAAEELARAGGPTRSRSTTGRSWRS